MPKKLTNEQMLALADDNVNGGNVAFSAFIAGYRMAEITHLKTISKLQKLIGQHRIIIETMYAPTNKKK